MVERLLEAKGQLSNDRPAWSRCQRSPAVFPGAAFGHFCTLSAVIDLVCGDQDSQRKHDVSTARFSATSFVYSDSSVVKTAVRLHGHVGFKLQTNPFSTKILDALRP